MRGTYNVSYNEMGLKKREDTCRVDLRCPACGKDVCIDMPPEGQSWRDRCESLERTNQELVDELLRKNLILDTIIQNENSP